MSSAFFILPGIIPSPFAFCLISDVLIGLFVTAVAGISSSPFQFMLLHFLIISYQSVNRSSLGFCADCCSRIPLNIYIRTFTRKNCSKSSVFSSFFLCWKMLVISYVITRGFFGRIFSFLLVIIEFS